MDYLVGIDLGSTRLKAAIYDLRGNLVAMGSPLWTSCLSSNRAEFPIQVVRDPLGKPHLLLGAHRGPAISFSEGGGKVWAALCGDESDIGIDVAEADIRLCGILVTVDAETGRAAKIQRIRFDATAA